MRSSAKPIYAILLISKIVVYSLVFYRAAMGPALSLPLIAIMATIVVCDLRRSLGYYGNPRINMLTLILNVLLASVFALTSQQGSYDKLYLIYAVEAVAVLPVRQALILVPAILAAYECTAAIDEWREYGAVLMPEFPQAVLWLFMMLLVTGERWQREQRDAYEKLNRTLEFTNMQLKESIAWNEALNAEAQRRRLAGELHDSLGHQLTALIISLEAGQKAGIRDPEASREYCETALAMARQALHSVRELVSSGAAADSGLDLAAALSRMTADIARVSGLEIQSQYLFEPESLSPAVGFQLYRIFQEALTNTLRHARARTVMMQIRQTDEAIEFIYKDDGQGTARIREGNGLGGIRERVGALNGMIEYRSAPGQGFTIEGWIKEGGVRSEQQSDQDIDCR